MGRIDKKNKEREKDCERKCKDQENKKEVKKHKSSGQPAFLYFPQISSLYFYTSANYYH